MGSISVSGIGFAALTAVLASSIMLIPTSLAAQSSEVELTVRIENLRSARGVVQACLTREAAHFPDCKNDPRAVRASVEAGTATLRFERVPPGDYALAVIHDENANGRLDTFAGIPREGFGFSRNPRIRFGPPRFEEARFTIGSGQSSQSVRIRYLL